MLVRWAESIGEHASNISGGLCMRKESIQVNLYSQHFLKPSFDFRKASDTAYMDMARHTLHLDSTKSDKQKVRDNVTDYLERQIEQLLTVMDEEAFDCWHAQTCDGMLNCYKEIKGHFNYGQAQKWLNLLIKYLYVYDVPVLTETVRDEKMVEWFHVPIDNHVISLAWRNFNLVRPSVAWSKMPKDVYQRYQSDLRKIIRNVKDVDSADERIPFYWELINWGKR